MQRLLSLLLLILFLSTINAHAQVDARMLQYPDVSQTHIVFSYGGDIWIASKQGGIAHKLTSADGAEIFPRFSPDGSQVAFTGNYAGNDDVYVMPSMGGLPKRITYHGMTDLLIDWFPDGKSVLFTSSRESGKQRFSQFYKVSDNGGLPDKLVVPYGEFGVLSPDGKKIAYTPRSRAFRTWKRYRGGMAADIWIFDLENKTAENISNSDANDEFPMWSGNKIYFLSDRGANQRYNIWSYDLSSKEIKQVTDFSAYDIHFPSMGPDEIVFEAGGLLYLLNLKTEKYQEVKISVVTDESTLMPKKEKANNFIQNFWPAHDGNRAVMEARGELFSLPAKDGPVLNVSQTSGTAERFPSWSPDGRYLAYWSDQSGEYELTVRDLKNAGVEKKLTSYGPGFRYQIFWSPNSKMMAFIDKAMEIFIYDMEKNKTTRVDKEKTLYEGGLENFSVSWSADSRYMAYAKEQDNSNSAIAVFDVNEGKTHQLTAGFYNDSQPVFDPDGKYIYFLTNRSFNSPVYSDLDNTWIYSNTATVAAAPLTSDIASPVMPKNDSTSIKTEEKKEEVKNKKEDKKGKKDEKGAETEKKAPEVKITYDNFEERIVMLTAQAGNYRNLAAVSGKVIYQKIPVARSGDNNRPIVYFDLENREEKTIVGDVDEYRVAADGKKMMVAAKGSYYMIDIAPDQKLEKKLPVERMEMTVVPREEWRQIFNDAWRFERDFFYDPNMHGVHWNAMREHYGKLLDYAITRWDVNYIIGELIAEISSSHTYRGGGVTQQEPHKPVGYLGIDWGLKDGAYYVKRIVKGAPWDAEERSPLETTGLKIKEGNYILAVNNLMIDVTKDPAASFEGLSDETVELTVNNKPTLAGSWKVLLKTMDDETRLRNLEWIESNRKRVEQATNGRIGYIYVPSTAFDGQRELVRMFYPQFNKEGLIIDERFNNGGQIPDRFIELLDRKPLAFWAVRDGKTWQWPPVANFGPKVMLINGWSGSGGDAFPDYFRKAGLGPLIGTRTWGGLIGISGAPTLIDGGGVTVPTFRMFDPAGTWFKEGYGVKPDIEVVDDPAQLAKGVDPQLERAIEEEMKLLKEKPGAHPERPAYEKR